MRLLLDESVPARLRWSLPSHSVKTVVEMGWGGVKNGALLALAAKEFELFSYPAQLGDIPADAMPLAVSRDSFRPGGTHRSVPIGGCAGINIGLLKKDILAVRRSFGSGVAEFLVSSSRNPSPKTRT